MLLCVINCMEPTIIASLIEFVGMVFTAVISVIIVIYQLKRQKKMDIINHEIKVFTECSSTLIASLETAVLRFRLFDTAKEEEKKELWKKVHDDVRVYLYNAIKAIEEIRLNNKNNLIECKWEILEREFVHFANDVANGISTTNDLKQLDEDIMALKDVIRTHVTKLKI